MTIAAATMRPPPRGTGGWVGWTRVHLFGRPLDVVLTLAIAALATAIVAAIVPWALIDATWAGASRQDCNGEGACWAFIANRYGQLVYGFYPAEQRWRVDAAGLLLALGLAALMVPRIPGKRITALLMLTGFPVVAAVLICGGVLGLPRVESDRWGGLMLTLVLGSAGIVCSFPIGILLALARTGELPVLRVTAGVFIELCRGLPLVLVLFIARIMLPLALPVGTQANALDLALTGIILFESAYLAEVVRGGLQAVPRGQREAAHALGFGYGRTALLVVLPQALRNVIPGIVNNSIALLKNTTFVMVLGLFDFLNVVAAGTADPQWLGLAAEGYVVVGLTFWLLCFGMSRYSRSIEQSQSCAREGRR